MTAHDNLKAALSAAETARIAAQTEFDSAVSYGSTTASQLALANANLANANAEVTRLKGEVARLQAIIDGGTPVPPTPTTPPLPAGWTKTTFFDDFTGDKIDTTKWNVRNNTTQSNMDGRNFAANVKVKDSVCSIGSGPVGADGKWPCGYLDTIGKHSQCYGRWEARMRVPWGPSANGFWPAFWLRPDDGGDGEIDTMEAWPLKNEIGPTTHSGYTLAKHVGYRIPSPPFDPTAWHVYAVEWEAGKMTYLVDNKVVYSVPYSTSWLPAIYARGAKYNIRLNLQMGGTWGGKPTAATDLSKTFDIDWVRVLSR